MHWTYEIPCGSVNEDTYGLSHHCKIDKCKDLCTRQNFKIYERVFKSAANRSFCSGDWTGCCLSCELGKMAMSLSYSMSSQITSGPHYLTLNASANTLCIPHFFTTLHARTCAGKRRSLYLPWGKGECIISMFFREIVLFVIWPYYSREASPVENDATKKPKDYKSNQLNYSSSTD